MLEFAYYYILTILSIANIKFLLTGPPFKKSLNIILINRLI